MVVAVIVRVVAPVIVRIVATGIVQVIDAVIDAVIAPVNVAANAARFARQGHADDGDHHHCLVPGAGLGAGACLCPVARPVMDVLRDAIVCVSLPVRDSLCAVPVAFRPAPGPTSAGRHAPTPARHPPGAPPGTPSYVPSDGITVAGFESIHMAPPRARSATTILMPIRLARPWPASMR